MPKTRDQKCRHVLKTYFENMPLTKKKYCTIEKNEQKGWSSAQYQVKFPLEWTIPSFEFEESDYSQELDVERLTSDEVMNKFRNHFEKYEMKSAKRATSYLRMYQSSFEDNNVIFRFMVKYFKSEIPFPEDKHIIVMMHIEKPFESIELLQKEVSKLRTIVEKKKMQLHHKQEDIMKLEQRNRMLVYKYRKQHEETMYQITDNVTHNKHYRTIINGLYKELDKSFECPICYEPIENDNTFTTHCNHVLCQGCADKCQNKCPMCRTYMGEIDTDAMTL